MTDYSQAIDDVKDYNRTKKRKLLIVFDYMIEDMEASKKIKSYSHCIVLKRRNNQYFTCFCIAILFQKDCEIPNKRTSTNNMKPFN